MLSRLNRLSSSRDFQKVFAKGAGFSAPFYTVRWQPNMTGTPRFGFVVANTISKKATQRNLIRRRLRECVRKNITILSKPYDIVIIVKPLLLTTPYRIIEQNIIYLLNMIQTRPFRERTGAINSVGRFKHQSPKKQP